MINGAYLLLLVLSGGVRSEKSVDKGRCACAFQNRKVPHDAAHLTPSVDGFPWTLEKGAGDGEVQLFTLTFPSPIRSRFDCNNTVWCEYYMPVGKTECPATVVLHFLADPGFRVTRLVCDQLARNGTAALLVKMAYYGERRPENPDIRLVSDLDLLVSGWIQSVQDIRCALSWLASRHEVDAERLGVTGISLGALVGSLVVSVDPRVKKAALVLGGGDLTTILWHAPETKQLRTLLRKKKLTVEATRRVLQPIEPLRFAAPLPEGTVFMINAKNDRTVPPACTRKLAEKYQAAELAWYDATHTGLAAYLFPLLENIKRFLQETS